MSGVHDPSFGAVQCGLYLVAHAFQRPIGPGEAFLDVVNRSFDLFADLAFVIRNHAADRRTNPGYPSAAAVPKSICGEFRGAAVVVDDVEGDGTQGVSGHGRNPLW